MKYLELNNVELPKIGFGTWTIGDDPSLKADEINVFETGYQKYHMNLIDTAEMYGLGKSERVVGEFLKGKRREDFFIVDKILPENALKGRYLESCKKSLEIMGLEYFDLYLLHWRSRVNLQEMVDEMENLVSLGLIKRWGVSNFDVKDMEELFKCRNGDKCFANQCLYNISQRGVEYDLIPWCEAHNVLFMAYSPFGSNKANRDIIVNNPYIQELVKKKNISVESLMLSFIIRHHIVITMFKTSSLKHLEDNMEHAFDVLTDEDIALIDKAFKKPTKKMFLEKI